ncbi:class I SAM-dependent methyltransferase [Tropicibacter sp. R16_0]|uniref:class I SAM-dependent methyltransferase n=1 Tax=Tropicibacter sp. R16_0 TaxID=2821102 RepID=UPI001ADCA93A|nr:class I SAM-dependent methyltransferase [Tropicibacter sp. R16_0]MBO9451881.1 class I SAM-dependent methyltransferase [Tropicibacter sp. R16_0]
MTQATAFWDGIAERYAKSPIKDVEAYEYTLERTRSYLGADDNVLELGAGTGSTALLLAPSVTRYVASDLSPKMTEIGRTKATDQGVTNVEFIAADVSDPQLAGTPYDTVLALNLLHLLPNLTEDLKHIHQMIKPGGLFISKSVCLNAKGLPLRLRIMKLAIPLMQLLGKAPFVRSLTIEELEHEVMAAGFEIIETGNYPAVPPSRYLVARRV